MMLGQKVPLEPDEELPVWMHIKPIKVKSVLSKKTNKIEENNEAKHTQKIYEIDQLSQAAGMFTNEFIKYIDEVYDQVYGLSNPKDFADIHLKVNGNESYIIYIDLNKNEIDFCDHSDPYTNRQCMKGYGDLYSLFKTLYSDFDFANPPSFPRVTVNGKAVFKICCYEKYVDLINMGLHM